MRNKNKAETLSRTGLESWKNKRDYFLHNSKYPHINSKKKKKKSFHRFQRYYPILDCACDVGSGDRITANYARNRLLLKPGLKNSERCAEFSRKTTEPIIFSCIELIIPVYTVYAIVRISRESTCNILL